MDDLRPLLIIKYCNDVNDTVVVKWEAEKKRATPPRVIVNEQERENQRGPKKVQKLMSLAPL